MIISYDNKKYITTLEAKEYRESLAIEKSLADNSLKEEEWIRHQIQANTAV